MLPDPLVPVVLAENLGPEHFDAALDFALARGTVDGLGNLGSAASHRFIPAARLTLSITRALFVSILPLGASRSGLLLEFIIA